MKNAEAEKLSIQDLFDKIDWEGGIDEFIRGGWSLNDYNMSDEHRARLEVAFEQYIETMNAIESVLFEAGQESLDDEDLEKEVVEED